MNAEKQFFKETVMHSLPLRRKAFLTIEDNRSSAIKQYQLKRAIQRTVGKYEDREEAKSAFKTSFVREKHFEDISTRSSDNVLSIRETGAESLKRLGENANPKPHSILDKSIKKSRLELNKSNIEQLDKLKMSIKDIEGFVGCWDAEGLLKGLILADIPKKDGKEMANIKKDGEKNYIELHRFSELKDYPDWQHYLYTGDYDLHEVYDEGGQLIPEGEAKATLLNKLNGRDDVITVGGNGVLENVPPDAYFQHGDQATYRESVQNEVKERPGAGIAVLVPSVAVEETGSLAWFVKNALWFISHDRGEHAEVRSYIEREKGIILKTPTTWKEDAAFDPKDISGFSKTKTKPYKAPYSGYKSGKEDEMFKFAYSFSPDFDAHVAPSILAVIEEKHGEHLSAEDKEARKAQIAKAKAINLIISNYKGITEAQKQHYTWEEGNKTYFYNGKKQYCVEVEDKTIKKFSKGEKVLPAVKSPI